MSRDDPAGCKQESHPRLINPSVFCNANVDPAELNLEYDGE